MVYSIAFNLSNTGSVLRIPFILYYSANPSAVTRQLAMLGLVHAPLLMRLDRGRP